MLCLNDDDDYDGDVDDDDKGGCVWKAIMWQSSENPNKWNIYNNLESEVMVFMEEWGVEWESWNKAS